MRQTVFRHGVNKLAWMKNRGDVRVHYIIGFQNMAICGVARKLVEYKETGEPRLKMCKRCEKVQPLFKLQLDDIVQKFNIQIP